MITLTTNIKMIFVECVVIRYNLLYGSFDNSSDDELDIIPMCDFCTDHYGIEAMTYYGGEIEILGRIFHIDTSVRAND